MWISGWRLRKAPENETKNRKTPFPISVDNLFLKIWSDHDTACDETRRLQSAV
ncbi:hypothetical protein SFK227_5211 [Shigella flexneri K-227]|uniref:Uncharacterized protein n=1 Tax=Shigella flexneri K-227 TaxID=766147 RepID=F5P3W6_SHIFL|nr:hypothetical protein SFK227_5211 [Shigella flexneri K-227]EHU79210.1 hypothetical protein ECDEC3C_0039 [Escherichia coli DEC3C]EHV51065.1 hypothetical protein ECDEC6A_5102 [Escherichia coli DEC6A]SJK91226.1 conserved hypothetical protein [Escherichia coli]